MNYCKYLKGLTLLSTLCIAFGLAACGSDSSSSSEDTPSTKSSSSTDSGDIDDPDSPAESSSSTTGPNTKPSDPDAPPPKSSASVTASSDEALNTESKKVNGTCAPEKPIDKGEIATWNFYRNEGEVYDQILAPFVWTFDGTSQKNVQGNGLQTVNVRYEESGLYKATLLVDGNAVECEELQVKGIPITVSSCKPNKSTVYTGEQISWTVEATSESEITGYTWASTAGSISGTGVEASMTAPTGLHKEQVTAVVTVENKDKTYEKYTCEGVTVLDQNHVDLVLTIGNSNDQDKYGEPILPTLPDSMFISSNTPTVVQVPAGAKTGCTIGCKPRVGADYMSTEVMWDSDEPVSNFAYFQPAGCAPGKTYTVTSSVNVLCLVQP